MNIIHRKGKEAGTWSLMEQKKEVGVLAYVVKGKRKLCVERIDISIPEREQEITQTLITEAITYCVEKRLLVDDTLDAVAQTVSQHPEWQYLLDSYDASEECAEEAKRQASEEKAQILQRYFKTGKGEYAEGDIFVGLTVPQSRQLLKDAAPLSIATITRLMEHPIHELRFMGFTALATVIANESDPSLRTAYYRLYEVHFPYCNNWDLVDCSAGTILANVWGDHTEKQRIAELMRLADTPHLWTQRIAMVGCFGFIRQGSTAEVLAIAQRLLHHPHDLIHKATGWMLRELGKHVHRRPLLDFLLRHQHEMSRTTFRYATEHSSPDELRLLREGKDRKEMKK